MNGEYKGFGSSEATSSDDEPSAPRMSFKRASDGTSSGPDAKAARLSSSVEESSEASEVEGATFLPNPTGRLLSSAQGDDAQLHSTYGPGYKLLAKHGYTAGAGLGKTGTGRVEPVGLSTQKGRRGLGTAKGETDTDYAAEWDFSKEDTSVEEKVRWIPPCEQEPTSLSGLEDWIKIGPKKMFIEDETQFLDSPDVLAKMIASKNVFGELSDREIHNARSRANPYETIKGAFFQNRAAVKMSNMDAIFDWLFTRPPDPFSTAAEAAEWVPSDGPNLFYFADVCAGPGGFTEYVLWKKGWDAHGFGMTLKGDCDFRLDKFLAAPPQMFETFYGLDDDGGEGDGDVTLPRNLKAFERFVKDSTADGEGCHLFMADGGFSVEGQENIQEILSKRIYLCQFLAGLSVLRPGGNFVCKLFDLFTPFSMGLIYLMYRAFDQISIHKPHTSRPANSERYIIGKCLRPSTIVREFMRAINDKLEELKLAGSDDDVMEVVPLQVMQDDDDFWDYMLYSNTKLAVRQTSYLEKYKVFAKNPSLMDPKQDDLRSRCMSYWELPDQPRMDQPRPTPRNSFEALVGEGAPEWMPRSGQRSGGGPLKSVDQLLIPANATGLDYRLAALCEDGAQLILATGRSFIFAWEGSRWEPLSKVKLFLPKNTLLFGEVTFAYRGKGKGQMKEHLLRIFDAHTLSGTNVSELPFDIRQSRMEKFCRAISHRLSVKDACLVEVAETWRGRDVEGQRDRWAVLNVRGRPSLALYRRPLVAGEEAPRDNDYIVTRGLFAHRIVAEPWKVCWSKSGRRLYYWSPPGPSQPNPVSIFQHDWRRQPQLVLSFGDTMGKRLLWNFGSPDSVSLDATMREAKDGDSEKKLCLPVLSNVFAVPS